MSDFAGDFELQLDQPTTENSDPQRPWRIPDFEAMRVENPARHPVVDRCIQAAANAFAEAYAAGQSNAFSALIAQSAYAAAMPDPVGELDTRNFIACVAYGIHSRMLEPDRVPRLLYAAQVALTGLSQKRKL
ncbi:MAG: hypothetical protein ACLGSD_05740 [Acidobacteriota bacterium]